MDDTLKDINDQPVYRTCRACGEYVGCKTNCFYCKNNDCVCSKCVIALLKFYDTGEELYSYDLDFLDLALTCSLVSKRDIVKLRKLKITQKLAYGNVAEGKFNADF